jgi:hypothetical protein
MPSFRRFPRLNLPIRSRLGAKVGGRKWAAVNRNQVNQSGDVTGAGDTDKGMSDPA